MSIGTEMFTVLSTDVNPDRFVHLVQEQIVKFTKAKVDDTYSLRIVNGFMQFNQGFADDEDNIILEVGFQQIKPMDLSYQTLGFSKEEIAKPLTALIAEAFTEDYAKQAVDRTVDALLLLGPMNAIGWEPNYVIFSFEKTNVLFMRHNATRVTH